MTKSASNNNKIPPTSNEQPVCSGCPETDKCRQVWSMPNQGPFTAAGLTLSSILVFLLPILTAIIAAAVTHAFIPPQAETTRWEIAAAVGGLIVGAVLALMLLPLIKKHFANQEKL